MKSYKDLDVYKIGLQLFYVVHSSSLKLPRYELYELGSQIRRSADSVVSNVIEGYGRRRYKADFIKFLVYSHSSCLETIGHLEKIKKLHPNCFDNMDELINNYEGLGGKIFNFIKYVEENWRN
ncbi:four helix bundle protein [Flavobacterium aquidurense]|uniref:four helix bundle protein n=1 Tax=Flavobacterium aquidurense TaxID=362413 RepID=UPI00371F78CE